MLAFVAFNAFMVFDLIWVTSRADQIRAEYLDNGWAQIGINIVANARLNELFVAWTIGAAVLGMLVLATRGGKQLVRRVVS